MHKEAEFIAHLIPPKGVGTQLNIYHAFIIKPLAVVCQQLHPLKDMEMVQRLLYCKFDLDQF